MKPTVRLTGLPEFDKKLSAMKDVKSANRIAKSVLGAEATVAKKAIKALADEWMKDTIGVRSGKNRGGVQETKVGVNVGKKSKKTGKSKTVVNKWAPVFVLGTVGRTRKALGGKFKGIKDPTAAQLTTGKIKPHPIVKQGMASAHGGMQTAAKKAFDRALQREITKAKLNKGK